MKTLRSRIVIGALWCLVTGAFWAPATVLAGGPACLISFDTAQLDVCTGTVTLDTEELAHLAESQAIRGSTIRYVKFDGPIDQSRRGALEELGAEILGYAPFHAYAVRMDPSLDGAARELEGVVGTGPFLPVWKLDVNLARELGGVDIAGQAGLSRLRVELQPGASGSELRNGLASIAGLDYAFTEAGPVGERLMLDFQREALTTAVEQLVRDDAVAAVSFHWPRRLSNSQAGWLHQGGPSSTLPVFEQGIFGCGQTVGILDSGLHVPHCSFSDADYGDPVFDNCGDGTDCPAVVPDFDHRKIAAYYKWSGQAGGPGDGHGHGTHVAGSAVGNNPADAVDCKNYTTPGGVTDLDGTAPGAHLIFQEAGPGLNYLNTQGGTIYHAAEVAYQGGARIHNNSWGSDCRNNQNMCIPGCQVGYRDTSRDADAVVWDFPELALIVAAGNSGSGCGPGSDVGAAGNAKNVFSIGSNQRGAAGDAMSGFSSRGPASDRRTKPDLTAQGNGILSANRNACGTRIDGGTSMASPTAAGLAALVREYLERGFYPQGVETPADALGNPSGALIKALMINGAEQIGGTGSGGDAPNQSQGWGRVNLDRVLHFDGDERGLWLLDETGGLATGGTHPHLVEVAGGQPLKVTLVWHDHPALMNANPHIVNHLRLEVIAPGGEVWSQKMSPDGGLTDPDPYQDTSDTNHDLRNTVHQIELDDPAPGTYELRVSATQVAEGGQQPYALVATGGVEQASAFVVQADPASETFCAGEPVDIQVSVLGLAGFDDEVLLNAAGLPPGSSGVFSANPVVPGDPPGVSTLTISGTGGVPAGDYPVEIIGQSDGPVFEPLQREAPIQLSVFDDTPGVAEPGFPLDGEAEVALHPAFSWSGGGQAQEYRIQVATDSGFEQLVVDEVVNATSYTPAMPLESVTAYFWRVRPANVCGEGDFSAVNQFSTQALPGDCPFGSGISRPWVEDFADGQLPPDWIVDGTSEDGQWVVSEERAYTGEYSLFVESTNTPAEQYLVTPPVELPEAASGLVFNFHTWQHLEAWAQGGCFTAATLDFSLDDGQSWAPVAANRILARARDGSVSSSWGSPMAGQPAWCGDPRDFWERYAVDLSPWMGEQIRFRFRFGNDSRPVQGREGWYVDAMEIQACDANALFRDRFEPAP